MKLFFELLDFFVERVAERNNDFMGNHPRSILACPLSLHGWKAMRIRFREVLRKVVTKFPP